MGRAPGRRTNLGLLVLLTLALVTGAAAFVVGDASMAVVVVVVAHGAAGLGLLVLSPWKSVVARRGLRRRRPGRAASLALSVVVLVAVLSGAAHATGLLRSAVGITALQVHVGAALVAVVLLADHLRRRPLRVGRRDLSRRSVLRLGLLTGASVATRAAVQGTTAALALPGARRQATGSYELGSGDPERMPVTSWLFDAAPDVDTSVWRLEVTAAGRSRRWSAPELAAFADSASAVLDCTGGWWSRQTWTGVRLTRLLPPGATGSVEVVSVTGYRRRLPLSEDLLLALAVGGRPLSAGHGGPARLVVPGRRGYHWVKWVDRIEHDDRPWWLQPPLPLR